MDQESKMLASNYDFVLPKELIAQEPLENRADSRLLVVNRATQSIEHTHFRDIGRYLKPDDCLVLNDTRVIPAQLVGKRVQTMGRWQGLVVESDGQHWKMLAKTRGKIQPGEKVMLHDRHGKPRCEMVLVAKDDGCWIGKPLNDESDTEDETVRGKSLNELLEVVGRIPLPHYIRGGNMVDADIQNYQTIYAKNRGSVAAPTAGLHFTKGLIEQLVERGVNVAPVTLHVGVGTFRPLSTDDLGDHKMHAEWCSISQGSVDTINRCRENGGRIIAVGTTSVRTLESVGNNGVLKAWKGDSDLFIKPGFEFKIVDALITNFHLPKSTLIVLVRTFGGEALMKRAYFEAVEEKYRFFSYGDAMLII
ncbi:MAG: tRNA preQ1(34) S-adenosylmethionine ribosyltransferase-isomerase QueA [Bacteroidota bacterium]